MSTNTAEPASFERPTMPARDRNRRRSFAHRLSAGCALAAYVAAALGGPLPLSAGQTNTQPFPCQQHACGCRSAEVCWKHCCCFSAEEKLAWAAAQHFDPPSYAEKPAELGWRTVRQRDSEFGQHSCDKPCCQVQDCGASAPRPAKHPDSNRGVNCPRCPGHSTVWVTTGTMPPPTPLSWQPYFIVNAWLVDLDFTAPVLPTFPPVPPPRPFA